MLSQRKDFTMSKNNIKQLVYKPKKEKIKMGENKKDEISFAQVISYFTNLAWEHRGFLLVTFILVENTLLLVRMH